MSRVRPLFQDESLLEPDVGIEPEMGRVGRTVLWMALLALITLSAGAFAVRGEFLSADQPRVPDNSMLRAWSGIKPVWRLAHQSPDFSPLTYTMFLAEARVWKLDKPKSATGYRTVSLLLHTGSVLLLLHLLQRLHVPGATAAAAVFAVHPANLSAVASISARPAILGTLLAIATLIVFARILGLNRRPSVVMALSLPESRAGLWVTFSSMWLLTCAASPALAASIGPIALLLLWWRDGAVMPSTRRSLMPALVATVLVILGAAAMTARTGAGDLRLPGLEHAALRPIAAIEQLVFYAGAVLVPVRYRYAYPAFELTAGTYVLALMGLGIVLATILGMRRFGRGPVVVAGVFTLLMFPAVVWVRPDLQLGGWVSIPRVYPATAALIVGLVASAAMGIRRAFPPGGNAGQSRVLWPAASALVLVVGIAGAARGRVHESEQRLHAADLAAGGSVQSLTRLAKLELTRLAKSGVAEERNRDLARAEGYLIEAAQIAPGSVEVWNGLGAIDEMRGRPERAMSSFLRARAIDPKNVVALSGLARCHEATHDSAGALAIYAELLELQPGNAELYNDMGALHYRRGEIDKAEAAFKKALQIDPRCTSARINYANLHYQLGRVQEAEAELTYIIEKINPDNFEVYMNAGAMLGQMKQYRKAAVVLGRAVGLRPEIAAAQSNLAMALLGWAAEPATNPVDRLNMLQEAKRRFERASELEPANPAHGQNAENIRRMLSDPRPKS